MTDRFRAELFRAHMVFAGVAAVIVFGAASCAKASETCMASWYGSESGPRTASGERFYPGGMTAAHRTRRFGEVVTVTHLGSGRSVRVRINDRGPAAWTGKCIDLAKGAALALGMGGTARVRVE